MCGIEIFHDVLGAGGYVATVVGACDVCSNGEASALRLINNPDQGQHRSILAIL
jgi:hypothetical protein